MHQTSIQRHEASQINSYILDERANSTCGNRSRAVLGRLSRGYNHLPTKGVFSNSIHIDARSYIEADCQWDLLILHYRLISSAQRIRLYKVLSLAE